LLKNGQSSASTSNFNGSESYTFSGHLTSTEVKSSQVDFIATFKMRKRKQRKTMLACLHDQNKGGFLEGRLISNQSEQSEKFSKSPDWLEKSQPSKKATFALIM